MDPPAAGDRESGENLGRSIRRRGGGAGEEKKHNELDKQNPCLAFCVTAGEVPPSVGLLAVSTPPPLQRRPAFRHSPHIYTHRRRRGVCDIFAPTG